MAELAQARLLGDLQVGEDSQTLAERYPQRYASARAKMAATPATQRTSQSTNATGTAC
jgi:hypothetical protein